MMIRGSLKSWFMLVVLVFVMVVAGEVWGIRTASAAASPIKLRMMMPSEPAGPGAMGSLHGGNAMADPIVYNVMEPLVDYTKDGPVPKLATKWEQRGPTIWRFYLRKGVKFHNGADFTSRDVVEFAKWNIELKYGSLIYQRIPLKEAVAVDDYTVDFIFEKPQPLHLISAPRFLIPPVAITRDNREMYKTNPIGTGPYKFVEWNRGMNIKMAKFEGYWGPKPQIDNVEITFRDEEQVRLAALLAGEVDWIYGMNIDLAAKAPKIARMPSPETVWIRFDESKKEHLLTDKRVRLAIDYAIDRQALVSLYGGLATSSLGQFASPGDFGFNPSLKARPYDLEKAKALIREANAVGKTVTLVSPADKFTKSREVAEAITYMLDKTGLKVKLMLMPKSEALKYWRAQNKDRFISDMYLNNSDAVLEVESRYAELFAEGGGNTTISDPEPTKLNKEVVSEIDFAKRRDKVAKAWAYAYEQAHYVPILKLEWMWGIAKNLEWKPDISGRPFFADMKFTD